MLKADRKLGWAWVTVWRCLNGWGPFSNTGLENRLPCLVLLHTGTVSHLWECKPFSASMCEREKCETCTISSVCVSVTLAEYLARASRRHIPPFDFRSERCVQFILWVKGLVHLELNVIIYPPSCHSKPVWLCFSHGTHKMTRWIYDCMDHNLLYALIMVKGDLNMSNNVQFFMNCSQCSVF